MAIHFFDHHPIGVDTHHLAIDGQRSLVFI